uniref:Nix isoform 6 n=1 Tax=Aedes albopictus TaxID=7160 RepID=A0A650AWI1_AEDAL|nr:Nix isoform 6 [Aedes albopictus]
MYSKSELNLINNQFEYIKKYCIYIGNIPAEVSKTDLIAKFSVFGEISNLYMKSFIQFCDVKPAVVRYRLMKSVKESSSLHNSRYIQSVLIVLPLDSSYNNYFLPYNTCVVVYTYNKFGMVDFYQKFSKLGDIHAMKKATNVMVYISFVSERAARTILDTKPTDIHINVQTINHVTRNINVCLIDFEKECTSNTAIKLTLLYNRSIGIFGLPSNFTEAKLHDEFSRYGRIEKSRLVYDSTGHFKQYGFVYYEKHLSAQAAKQEMDRSDHTGRKIAVCARATKDSTRKSADYVNYDE